MHSETIRKARTQCRLRRVTLVMTLSLAIKTSLAIQPVQGGVAFEFQDVPASAALWALAQEMHINLVASGELGSERLTISEVSATGDVALNMIAARVSARIDRDSHGVDIARRACAGHPVFVRRPWLEHAHQIVTVNFQQIDSEGVGAILKQWDLKDESPPQARPVAVYLRDVDVGNAADVIATSDERYSDESKTISCGRAEPFQKLSAADLEIVSHGFNIGMFRPEQLRMIGWIRKDGGAPVAILEAPVGRLLLGHLGEKVGPASARITGVCSDGVGLSTDVAASTRGIPYETRLELLGRQ